MSAVDLLDPGRLREALGVLQRLPGSVDGIHRQAQIATQSLIAELAAEASRCDGVVRRLESDPGARDGDLGRAREAQASAHRRHSSAGRSASELLASLSRAVADVNDKAREGAHFLDRYERRLAAARQAFAAASSASVVTPAFASAAGGDAALTARSAVRGSFGGSSPGDLSSEETQALVRYTSDAEAAGWNGHWYEIANALLRGERSGEKMTIADLERFEREGQTTSGIAAALRGLDKLPLLPPGEIHRGVGFASEAERGAFLAQFVPGGVYEDHAFFSASTHADVARRFAGDHGVVLHVSAQSARSAESVAGFREREAILRPWTRFHVERVAADGREVWLRELDG